MLMKRKHPKTTTSKHSQPKTKHNGNLITKEDYKTNKEETKQGKDFSSHTFLRR